MEIISKINEEFDKLIAQKESNIITMLEDLEDEFEKKYEDMSSQTSEQMEEILDLEDALWDFTDEVFALVKHGNVPSEAFEELKEIFNEYVAKAFTEEIFNAEDLTFELRAFAKKYGKYKPTGLALEKEIKDVKF